MTARMPASSRQRTSFGTGIPIGRIAGIEVSLHWTWPIAAIFIALSLADSVFPSAVGGLPRGTYLAMGFVTAVLFFATLLLHELGHALQARRDGLPTRGITLWMLGGVAVSGAPFPRAAVEARVAAAGPAVSLVVGVALVAIGRLGGIPDSTATVLEWLGWTNLLLLAFNLLPAFPLDGGRLLRAALWGAMRDEPRATRAAIGVSRGLACILIAGGLIGFVLGIQGGLWLAFVGWFVITAARAELQAVYDRRALT
jgi:Zn-dependent protease